MKSIQRRFAALKKKNEGHGDYIIFLGAIKWQNFSKDTISRWLTKLVPEDEYGRENRESLIRQLVEHSKGAEDDVLERVRASTANVKTKNDDEYEDEFYDAIKGELLCF